MSLAFVAVRWSPLNLIGAHGGFTIVPAFAAPTILATAAVCTAALAISGRARTTVRQLSGAALLTLAATILRAGATYAFHAAPRAVAPAISGPLPLTIALAPILLTALILILIGLGAAQTHDSASRATSLRLRRLTDASREGIVVLGEGGVIADCNAAFAVLAQRELDQLVGTPFLGSLLSLKTDELPFEQTVEGVLTASDGEPVPVDVLTRHLVEPGDDGAPPTIVLLRDLREQRAAEMRVRYLAEHDLQTGLANRNTLHAALRQAHDKNMREGGAILLALACVVNSKEINDTYGRDAGDALLLKISERLKRFAGDGGYAARQGGADFAFVGFRKIDSAAVGLAASISMEAVGRLNRILRRPFDYCGVRIEPKVVFGVSTSPYDASSAEELFAHAESALDRAKRTGEPICLFLAEAHEALQQHRRLARELRTAIDEDQLVLFYQPQAAAATGTITGFEALVRWRHPVQGLLSPDKFIPVAEAEGLIVDLGEWVLRRACLDAATWNPALSVAVNLSPLQIGASDLPTRVHELLLETGLSPSRLELEVTESALFGDQQRALDTLRRLKALGLRIAMDDFGTGYSSLSSLHSFPFDKIKIDKSFVEGIGRLERSTVLVRAVLGIGRGLGVPVVAEGVETLEQMAFLRAESCASIQGYYIGRPAPLEAIASCAAAPQIAHRSAG